MTQVFEAAKAAGRSDEMIVLFRKDGVPAELIELLKTAKTDRGEIERSYTDGKLSVIEEAQE